MSELYDDDSGASAIVSKTIKINDCMKVGKKLGINNEQINPHASKDICDALIEKKLIYGCGKPFQLIKNNNKLEAVICNYI